ncbi:acetylornithine deacetylase [Deinococcus metalli]|uniref:Probable succinyl-diaminopimelate desuccinylase n=1 Tax=Deinococcus metalli TaxID=1141878 RepID=A0A7W8KG86_9DEIO|nr:ArgE/DapE family deacylase [Deinococcus metalli]MBB5376553.1 acetylornithine deacetylase [Deinococcus metalli]GHF43165.1 acetylornithine deacetylase [Deinococcus metalli]
MSETLSDLLAALVRSDSTNPSLVPGGAGEGGIARFVGGWLAARGIAAELDEAAPGRVSVIARVPGTGGGRSVMLNAHLDTVGTEGMARPFDPVVQGGRMSGRGTYDMKGGLAACLLALVDARDAGLRGDVILTAVADEEHASLGVQSVLQRVRADAAIVAEPTELSVCTAHKGFTWHEITTHGRAAHGSRPDLGVDAIAHMGRVIGQLEALGQTLASRPAHPLLGHGSVHASLITGGQELSSYPERSTLHVERRTLPGETPDGVTQEIEALLSRLRADPTFHAEHRVTLARDPFGIDPGAPIVQAVLGAATTVLGTPPAVIGQTFWMDSAFLAAAGIPTVVFGPAGGGAHATEEWVDLDSVQQCREVYTATLRAICA